VSNPSPRMHGAVMNEAWWTHMVNKSTSDRSLKRYYRIMNTKFFDGNLSDKVLVRWAKKGEEKDIACADKLPSENKNEYIILLNPSKVSTDSQKLSSLLHEMIHVATKCADDHGPTFSAWHKKLTNRGAFKKGAVLADTTLF